MSEDVLEEQVAQQAPDSPPQRWLRPLQVRVLRYLACTIWLVVFCYELFTIGIPTGHQDVLLWAATGAAALTIGKRRTWTVLVDFLPLALVLVAYDYLRGASKSFGMPTWWKPQLRLEKALFLGNEPGLWLQEHLKFPDRRWWDVPITLCYMSLFVLPYVTAAVLWLRSRRDFYRWSGRYVAISLIGFAFFALVPTAPPWAASRCAAVQVADHPNDPTCIYQSPARTQGGLIGLAAHPRPGAKPYLERTSTGGFVKIGLKQAKDLVDEGQGSVDKVAAFPSLHAGVIMLFSMFMWRRVRRRWRPVLAGYAVLMGFTVVYTGDHYVVDVLGGWALAAAVTWAAPRVEAWVLRRREQPAASVGG